MKKAPTALAKKAAKRIEKWRKTNEVLKEMESKPRSKQNNSKKEGKT